jgi:glycosyltransferase involved in cell wall biosynthesis
MERKIYFICPDNSKPAGGVKQIYRQVDILNKNGFNACVLHKKKGFKSNWFENSTKIQYNRTVFTIIRHLAKKHKNSTLKKKFNQISIFFQNKTNTKLDEKGILVFPEIFGQLISDVLPQMDKVIFNQNCYYTFVKSEINAKEFKNPYSHPKTLATIVVSEDSKNYINFVEPQSNLFRIRLGIDSNNFHYSNNKKKQIAFMPRKLSEDVIQVINILKCRNNIVDWSFVSIENKSENEVAQIMKESYIYLSFNYNEGFGLPPAEAMACGCIVIGYSGMGGHEYFNPDFTYEIHDRDVISFAKKVEEVALQIDTNNELMIKKGESASSFILNQYNLKNEENDIVKTWKSILKKQTI